MLGGDHATRFGALLNFSETSVLAFLMHADQITGKLVQIRQLIAQGSRDDAQRLAGTLIDDPVQSLDEAQAVSKLLAELGLRGPAEIAILRFIEAYPEDRKARLAYIALRFEAKPRVEDLVGIFRGFEPETLNEYVQIAGMLSKAWLTEPTILVCRRGVEKFPDNVDLWSWLIENFNRKLDHSSAYRAITNLMRIVPEPGDARIWSFIAEQSGIAGEEKIFGIAAAKAETLLKEADSYPRFVLLRAHDRRQNKSAIERLFADVRIDLISDDWTLSGMLELAERYWLQGPRITLARRVVDLKLTNSSLRERCEAIMSKYNEFGEAIFAKKSLWL